jgi:translation elongation factor EF-Tu-like GTPase
VTKELRGAEVELCFLTAEQGGRCAPLLVEPGTYRPHFVAQGGDYLGVVVTRGPSEPVSPGVLVCVVVGFPYDVSYVALSEGTAFEVMEGERLVGEGRVLRLF